MKNDKFQYLETNRFVEESKCKYYKRLIVGLVRYFQNEDGELIVPETYFDNIPDDLGFSFDFIEAEFPDEGDEVFDARSIKLSSWKSQEQDCGGDEEDIDDVSFCIPEDNVVHLKIVKSEDTI